MDIPSVPNLIAIQDEHNWKYHKPGSNIRRVILGPHWLYRY